MIEAANREELLRRLDLAARCFENAADSNKPVLRVTQALQNICAVAALVSDVRSLDPVAAERLAVAIPHVPAVLAPLVARTICAERIYLGMGVALALVTIGEDGLRSDRILHSGALIAELNLFTCRQEMAARGDPLSRAMSIRRAMEALPLPGAPLH